MPEVSIEKSVGKGGKNKPIDVALIQSLLKKHYNTPENKKEYQKFAGMLINGHPSKLLNSAIETYQSKVLNKSKPDSRVDPGGSTFKSLSGLLKDKNQKVFNVIFGAAPVNSIILSSIPAAHFKVYFKKYYGLTTTKGEDFNGFFDMLRLDPEIKDVRWAAYMLATAYHETMYSFKPRREAGKGAGEKYSKKYTVEDKNGIRGKKGAKYENVYYGRGYVQLTWDRNYKLLGKKLGLGDQLHINPDMALDKKLAYKITSIGMREGYFTDLKLSDFITMSKTDYIGARKIINGNDKGVHIAEYAEKMEMLLRLAARSITPTNNKK